MATLTILKWFTYLSHLLVLLIVPSDTTYLLSDISENIINLYGHVRADVYVHIFQLSYLFNFVIDYE